MPLIIGDYELGSVTNVFSDEDDRHTLSVYDTISRRFYKIILTDAHRMCMSGWQRSSCGEVDIRESHTCDFHFKYYSEHMIDSSLLKEPSDFKCDYFEYSKTGGDDWYPTGYVKMDSMYFSPSPAVLVDAHVDMYPEEIMEWVTIREMLKPVHEELADKHSEFMEKFSLAPPSAHSMGGSLYLEAKAHFHECSGETDK